MDDNELIPDTPLGDHDRILTQAPISKSAEVTKGIQLIKAVPKLKAVRSLLITSLEDKKKASIYNKQVLKAGEVQTVNSWQEMAILLREYQSIDQLVLWFHGSPGALEIGSENKNLNQVSSLFTGQKPKVKEINFEACSVAEAPENLVPFARLFKASKVTAWNYFCISLLVELQIPKGVDVDFVENQLAPYKGYLLSGTPAYSELSKKPGKHFFLVEWFRKEDDNTPLPPPPKLGEIDNRNMTFKPRSAAKKRRIISDKVMKLREEYAKPGVLEFEHVIIEISGAL